MIRWLARALGWRIAKVGNDLWDWGFEDVPPDARLMPDAWAAKLWDEAHPRGDE
jgi:hypothetical protein